MPFTSPTFLFIFLPALLAAHTVCRQRGTRNLLLLAASLLFYTWGEGRYVLVLLALALATWALAWWLERTRKKRHAGVALAFAVAVNLAPLAVLKYAGFAAANVNRVLGWASKTRLPSPDWSLPAGISFFTFMAITYLVAVHRGEVPPERNPLRACLAIALFPLIMAGPIMRYRDLAPQLALRHVTLEGFFAGVRRFTHGLAKKALLANTLALPTNAIFALPHVDLSAGVAWFGVACYSLQIFFDFSGYSDMAIGLGRMLGFRFMENFDAPYASPSLRAFWTRWHISLSSWFRDYVFLPLAYPASRAFERLRLARIRSDFLAYAAATLATMLLIGLWHGASWMFIAWGLYHGIVLILERTALGKRLSRLPKLLQHVYAVLVIMVGWVLFRATSAAQAGAMVLAMCGQGQALGSPLARYATPDVVLALVAGAVLSTRAAAGVRAAVQPKLAAAEGWRRTVLQSTVSTAEVASLAALLVISLAWLSASTVTPFIYFRF